MGVVEGAAAIYNTANSVMAEMGKCGRGILNERKIQ
jgi:hypothetical protein